MRGAVALLFGRRRIHHVVVALGGGRLAGQRRQLVVRMPVAYDGRFARFDELGRAQARHRILGLWSGRKDVVLLLLLLLSRRGSCGVGRCVAARRTVAGGVGIVGAHFGMLGHYEGTRLLEQRAVVHEGGNQRQI